MPLKLSAAVWQTTPTWRYLDTANAVKQPWLGKLLKSAPNFWQRKYPPHKKADPKCAYAVADADPLRLKIVSPTQVLVVGISAQGRPGVLTHHGTSEALTHSERWRYPLMYERDTKIASNRLNLSLISPSATLFLHDTNTRQVDQYDVRDDEGCTAATRRV